MQSLAMQEHAGRLAKVVGRTFGEKNGQCLWDATERAFKAGRKQEGARGSEPVCSGHLAQAEYAPHQRLREVQTGAAVLYCVTPVCILKKKHRARHG